jgi:TRAP-type C4-dicarboxylate transport system permease small subunit
MVHRILGSTRKISRIFNGVAGVGIVVMMLLVTLDVILRFFRNPIPGTYEMAGLLGTVIVSFSLAWTFLERGHIVVEFLVGKLPRKTQWIVDGINDAIGLILFTLVTWQTWVYGTNLRSSGEVSLTIQVPLYPFLYGISIGCGLLCIAILADLMDNLRRIQKS